MRRKRPEQKLIDVVRAMPGATSTIDKRFTTIKAAGEEGTGTGSSGQMFTPNDEQLAKINQFTRREVSAEEVACFTTMSCNDILDRDLDRFRTKTINDFAKLPGSRSSVGKSFMVSHDTTKLPVGRIYDVGTQKLMDGDTGETALSLTNEVFIPRLPGNEDFIGNMEFGVYWAVSVGVMMGAGLCSIGSEHAYNGRWWCSQGHEKGLFYDPESDEKDAWGWPEPCEETDKGAMLCTRDLTDPKDFYELSMVYLGAQYMAELGKDPEFSGVIKAASKSVPFIGLGAKEARRLPLQHVNEKVADAYRLFKVVDDGEGRLTWVDDRSLVYTYDPEDDMVQCMGLSSDAGKVAADQAKLAERLKTLRGTFAGLQPKLAAFAATKSEDEDNDADTTAELLSELINTMRSNLEAENYEVLSSNLDDAEQLLNDLTGLLGVQANPDDDESKEVPNNPIHDDSTKGATDMSKKAVLAAAKAAGLPTSITEKLIDADDDTALSVVLSAANERLAEQDKQITNQAGLVEAGEKYLKDLRGEVLNAYVKAFQLGDASGADTTTVEKFIDRCGDDPDLLKELRQQYEQTAEGKLPKPVRRSSFDTDANAPNVVHPVNGNGKKSSNGSDNGERRPLSPVSRIHGR